MTPKMLSDAVMRLVDLLAMNPAETREIDPRSWDRLRIYMPNDPYAEAIETIGERMREALQRCLDHFEKISGHKDPSAMMIQAQDALRAWQRKPKTVLEIVTVSPAVAQKETDPAPGSGSPLKSAIGASGGGREDGDSPAAETENEKGQTEAEALGFDRELSREAMESGDRAMAKLATENGIRNTGPTHIPPEDLNRRVEVEQHLLDAATGKRPLPDADTCKALAYRLGVPDELRNGPSLGNVPLLVERVKATARRFVNGEPCWCHHPINTGHKPNCADLRASLRAIEAMAVTSQFSMCPRGCGVSHDPAFACPAEGNVR